MKRSGLILVMIFIGVMFATVAALAQSARSPWPFFAEATPGGATAGIYQLVVPLQVMDKARADLADLRLYDSQGREIPYALRVRKEIDEKREMGTRLFNRVTSGNNTTEVSLDLGEYPGEHNELEIETAGSNFRRRVEVEGSDTGVDWKTLKTGDAIFEFESQNRIANSNRVTYPLSRYRYLRLRVHADELTDKRPPDISSVKVLMVAREAGLLNSWDLGVPPYQLLRNQGAPSSSWTIDLGARVPCDRLALTIDDESFSRSFQVEVIDDPQNLRLVASGELARRLGEEKRPLKISFDEEVHARKLRLLITDYSNPTLSISEIKAGAPARQLYFELKDPAARPLRLYFGNVAATAPHYDFEKEWLLKLVAPPVPVTLGAFVNNPDYRPEPLPFTERVPWLIYVVLTISSVALALILLSLARAGMRIPPNGSNQTKAEPSPG